MNEHTHSPNKCNVNLVNNFVARNIYSLKMKAITVHETSIKKIQKFFFCS